MNTTLKGDSFEQRIRNVISSLIENSEFCLVLKGVDEMWIVPKDSKTFNKKKYIYPYGRDVVIDVSVEPPLSSEDDFLNNRIYIASSLKSDKHRYRFVFAHEIGHSYLHRKLLMKIISSAEDVDLDRQRGGADWEKRLEIQANLFASYLLIPENPMINKYFEVKRELGYSDRQRFF